MPILNVVLETGEKATVCLWNCGHEVCSLRHAIAVSSCKMCHHTIGYHARFHRDPRLKGFVHSECLAHAVEAVRQEQIAA
jgi:hypothetical protein